MISLSALRNNPTLVLWSVESATGEVRRRLTNGDASEPLGFPEKTVELPHFVKRGLRPSLSREDFLDLLSQGRNDAGVCQQMKQGVGKALFGYQLVD